jgi:ech hydrogenase subunit B
MLGLCSLFWATSWEGMVALVGISYFLEILIDNTCARLNWRWMLTSVLAFGLTLSLFNLVWLTMH